jgi:hypothetical protein
MRRSALESLQRGVVNLAANWQLVVAQLVRALLVTLLTLAGLVPLGLAIGLGTLRSFLSPDPLSSGSPTAALEEALASFSASAGNVVLALMVAVAVWTVALVVSSYFQAGSFGVLARGDRRSPLPRPERSAFRAFSLAGFKAAAERNVWRFFWLVNLFLLFGLGVLLILATGLGLTAWLAAREAGTAALLGGCATLAAALLAAVVLGLWWQTSLAATVVKREGLWASVATGFKVLTRRPGAIVAVFLVVAAVALTIFVVLFPVSLVIEVAMREALWAYAATQVLMTLVQSMTSGVLGLAAAGAVIALVGGEVDRPGVNSR